MMDSWHGDNKGPVTRLDRALTGRVATVVALGLGYAYVGWKIWLAVEWVRSLS